jgi:protein subunit release factor B
VHVSDDGYETGVEACCQLHRSQFKNRQAVQEMIEWVLANA